MGPYAIITVTIIIFCPCLFSIKMEVGIEDCLHIEFEYNKSKYAIII